MAVNDGGGALPGSLRHHWRRAAIMDGVRITTANLDDGECLAAECSLPRVVLPMTDCHV